MVWIEGKTIGSNKPTFEPFGFDPVDTDSDGDVYRVRHLIAKLVREAVRDFNLRENRNAFRALTPDEVAKGVSAGKIGNPREEKQQVNLDEAIGQALQAFEDGLYLLFVDSEEKKSLEEIVSLVPDTKVTVIRLTALAGA